ncbi:MAG TPA: ATP-binding domain-containing protein [Hydrogenophilus thermoluteolus]|nr:ATP-binding domain-containing protein [Hydrogenophilus thermoluteolus]
MARVFPDDWAQAADALPAGLARELEIVSQLARDLPDDWLLFHSIPWEGEVYGTLRLGEWDIVAVSPAGKLAILEVKAGEVRVQGGRLIKRYRDKTKHIDSQVRTQQHAMIGKLKNAGIDTYVGHVLVLPDAQGTEETAATVKSRVVDAAALPHLAQLLTSWIRSTPPDAEKVARIAAFLRNEFDLALDARAFANRLRLVTRRLQEGLATTLAHLHLPPGGTLQIDAAAGSGKTMLAGRWLEAARLRGERWRYLCFNRPLADALRAAWPQAEISTFHELAIEALRRKRGKTLDFSQPQIFADAVAALEDDTSWAKELDGLIIDEAMDLTGPWFAAVAAGLPSQTRRVLLYDSEQRAHLHALAETTPWWTQAFAHAPVLSVEDNFRSPRRIVDALALLGISQRPMRARSPFAGDVPEFIVCADTNAILEATAKVLEEWLAAGIAVDDIAVLSFASRKSSFLLQQEKLGARTLKRFLGDYEGAQPRWSEGEVLCETVLRFKGQSAPAVLLTEIDWHQFDDAARRKLYIGITRAEWRVALVLTQRAADDLERLLTRED